MMHVLLAAALLAQAPAHVKVTATFLPARTGANAVVAVTLNPIDPSVRVNEDPAPRLKLEDQAVLLDKQAPRKPAAPYDPARARYLDPALPVTFAVALNPKAPKGEHSVEATVTYFYCSKTEGWCRKGTAEIELPVRVP